MPDTGLTNSRIIAAYRERTRGSESLAREAQAYFPSGITHDSRYLEPYGIYVERAKGPRKWDVDGNEYVDYFGGHGALILGHGHPTVMAAAHAALETGTHFGASNRAEMLWAKEVQALVPSAERVRFTSSGTEATHLALRLARAHTGRRKLARLMTHFHGWHDHMTSGYTGHFDGSPTPGVLPEVAASVVLLPPNDLAAVDAAFAADRDIAAIILEPTGATFGMVPIAADYLRGLRDLCTRHGVVLIFDEVVTGFRVSPGGAQAEYAVVPDMSTLAKILSGGLPGGAIVGRKAIMDQLDHAAMRAAGKEKIEHHGTYNANPLSAAAGAAALEIIRTTDACARANAYGAELRQQLNTVLTEQNVPWAAYGTFSGFHIFTNPKGRPVSPRSFDPAAVPYDELKTNPPVLTRKFRLAMLINGVEVTGWPGGTISATHGQREMEQTVAAFRESLLMLKREGEL